MIWSNFVELVFFFPGDAMTKKHLEAFRSVKNYMGKSNFWLYVFTT